MKKRMMGLGLVAVAVLGCSRENLKNKDDEMEKVELNLTVECSYLPNGPDSLFN